MNETETLATLAALTAAYPSFELSRPTAESWALALRSVQVDDAQAVVARLIRTKTFFPSIAEFFNEESAARRAREHREAAVRGLPEVSGHRPRGEEAQGLVRQLKEELDYGGARGHWHGGPDPCPKCGGMTDKPGTVVRDAAHDPLRCETCKAGQHWLAIREGRAS